MPMLIIVENELAAFLEMPHHGKTGSVLEGNVEEPGGIADVTGIHCSNNKIAAGASFPKRTACYKLSGIIVHLVRFELGNANRAQDSEVVLATIGRKLAE